MFSANFRTSSWTREIRQSIRTLVRRPWYSLTVLGVIGLSMAFTVSAFRLVDGVLFKPLPYPNAGNLFLISGGYSREIAAAAGQPFAQDSGLFISARDVRDLAATAPDAQFTMIGAGSPGGNLGDLRAWSPYVMRVDINFLSVLGVVPLVGGFGSEDFAVAQGEAQPVLLSYRFWQSRLNGRADVVGDILSTESTDGRPTRYRITGILPREFVHPTALQQPDVLAPLVLTSAQLNDRTQRSFRALVRLPADFRLAEVQRRFNDVGRVGRAEIPDRTLNGGLGYWDLWTLQSLSAVMTESQKPTFWLAFGAAGVLLLLGCLNVSGLVVARTADRTRELAVRRWLGADSLRIGRLVVTECLILITVGSMLGVIASEWLVTVAQRLLPGNLELLHNPGIDWRVVLFVLLLSTLSSILVSFWPLRSTLRSLASDAMARTTGRQISGKAAFVCGQVALALVLTIVGALVGASLMRIWQSDLGYSPSDLLVVDGVGSAAVASGRLSALDELLTRVRQVPGVTAVGATQSSLLRGTSPGGEFKGDTYRISPGFFDAVAPTLVSGRLITAEELRTGEPVVVVSRSLAMTYFSDGSAVGRSLPTSNGKELLTIVGVVGDARYSAWNAAEKKLSQAYRGLSDARRFSLAIRIAPNATAVLQKILEAAPHSSGIRLTHAALAEDLLSETIRSQRFRSWLFGCFSLGGLAIVGVGILGLVSAMAVRRTREVGIRMAIGSTSSGVIRLLLREEATPVLAGVVVGMVGSAWAVGFVQRYLYGLTIYDTTVWAACIAVILFVAGVAVLGPAIWLSRTNPARALTND